MARILVINPNSSVSVTSSMDRGLAPLRASCSGEIACVTLAEGPPGIETQADIESVVLPLSRLIAGENADAYVIACFSDPGLALARETSPRPVVGIAELTRVSMNIASSTYRPLEAYLGGGLFYLAINLCIAGLGGLAERRLAAGAAK